MSNQLKYIQSLIKRALSDTLSSEEWNDLFNWINSEQGVENADWIAEELGHHNIESLIRKRGFKEDSYNDILNKILYPSDILRPSVPIKRRRGIYFFKAAAIVLLASLIGGVSYWTVYNKSHNLNKGLVGDINVNKAIILPGKNQAVLTLSDGSSVTLNDSSSGMIAVQGNSSIEKTSNGRIIYNETSKSEADNVLKYNQLTTPDGGQYFVLLPDGTKVWLNSGTSLKYPVSFSDKKREVDLEGEAYFEVAKKMIKNTHNRLPFIVNIVSHLNPSLNAKVEVLGTHFNVQAYSDEDKIKTTLLEGKVNFYTSLSSSATKLLPGYQVVDKTRDEGVSLMKVNVDQVVAWKNGYFDFNQLELPAILSQLARWYNLKVVYKGSIPKIEFYGKMERSLNLSDVLSSLQLEGVHFKLEADHTLVVTK